MQPETIMWICVAIAVSFIGAGVWFVLWVPIESWGPPPPWQNTPMDVKSLSRADFDQMLRPTAPAFVIAFNVLADGAVHVETMLGGRPDASYTPVPPGRALAVLVERAMAEVAALNPPRRDPS